MKVLLGMSGGVDSSVSAVILKEQGYEVIGCTMIMCDNNDPTEDAKKVCETLNIKHIVLDCKKEFEKYVINDFIEKYKQGKTPNPCVECNRFLKFGLFYEKALELGCDFIATGHYAKIEFSEEYNTYVLKKADNLEKDQSYFLYNIPKDILPKIKFPLGKFSSKQDIRKIAEEHELIVAKKKDSQEICFVENDDYVSFLERKVGKQKEGNIVDRSGRIYGKHKGLMNYTIGQRKGLGIANEYPLFVLEQNLEKNELIVGKEEELYSEEVLAEDINYLLEEAVKGNTEIDAKIRYSKNSQPVMQMEKLNKGDIRIKFKIPQRAITRGQSIVLYKRDIVVAGGKIL